MDKLRKESEDCLEHLLNIRYGNYIDYKKMKESGKQTFITVDMQKLEVPLDSDFLEQVDSCIDYAWKQYLDALKFVGCLGYVPYMDEMHSKFCDSGRVHRVLPHPTYVNYKRLNWSNGEVLDETDATH